MTVVSMGVVGVGVCLSIVRMGSVRGRGRPQGGAWRVGGVGVGGVSGRRRRCRHQCNVIGVGNEDERKILKARASLPSQLREGSDSESAAGGCMLATTHYWGFQGLCSILTAEMRG